MNNNELIVNYIGGKLQYNINYNDYNTSIKYYKIPACEIPISNNNDVFIYSENDLCKFQTDWNWIIPVTKKIVNDKTIKLEEMEIINQAVLSCDIKKLYFEITKLLNEYEF